MTAAFILGVAPRAAKIGESRAHRCIHIPEVGAVALIVGSNEAIGGRTPAEIAEQFVRDAIARSPLKGLDSLAALIRELDTAQAEHRGEWDWGASIVIAVVDGSIARIAHVGEVQAFSVRELTGVTRLTLDDRLLDRVPAALSAAQATTLEGILTQDAGTGTLHRIGLIELDLRDGDRLVLVSSSAATGLAKPSKRSYLDLAPSELAQWILDRAAERGEKDRERTCLVIAV